MLPVGSVHQPDTEDRKQSEATACVQHKKPFLREGSCKTGRLFLFSLYLSEKV